ncbi:drug/metabolite transporter (DMT)-like permease [Anaerosolibacter carboniphilus]|uniref:Drug/metabolite transporter (DMT)-like permease n=1 Tax=Anaerosolibacter carboniphilus TaxID=1417629 RepID=A0A841KYR1_9FIRM|nr:DMT family transporter [Anaerosolibacter carboniphilus]MBB6215265.1 drug/metabolite transporter (DMT)-like permease [Anaerosolibacter carboniphilus]
MKKTSFLAYISIIFTALIWGLSFLSIKVTIAVFPPMTLAFIRFVMASIIIGAIFKIKEKDTRLAREDRFLMVMAGFLGITVYFYFENNGVKFISASNASMIIAAIPIFTLIFEAIVFKTRLTLQQGISVLISFLGVYLIVGNTGGGSYEGESWLGYLMMFGAVFCWVAYSLITKPLFEKYSQLAIVYYQTIIGTVLFVPFVLFEKTDWHLVNGKVTLNVLFLGIFCSALAYYLYVYAMDIIGVSNSSLYLNLIPIVTVVASFLILKETVGYLQILGGILVVASVYLVNYKGSENRKETITIKDQSA